MKCHYCAEEIKDEATVCPHCRNTIIAKNPALNAFLMLVTVIMVLAGMYYGARWMFRTYDQDADRRIKAIQKQGEQDIEKSRRELDDSVNTATPTEE